MADARNEPVSISDVAKRLRESARDDRLDFRPEVAELLLRSRGITDVTVEATHGFLSDHYDPRTKTLRLSAWGLLGLRLF